MLSIESLSINYPNKELPALRDVSFELPKGAVCLLSGDSGSGQTTLCLAIAGILQHARPEVAISGSIRWSGGVIRHDVFRPEIAITLENPYAQLTGLKRTVREELAFGLEMRGFPRIEMNQRIQYAAERFGIIHLLSRNPKTLSGGETQKVVIASSYLLMPELWILDRPLTELDPLSRFKLLQTLKELATQNGTTVIITEEPDADIYSIATHSLAVTCEGVTLSSNATKDHAELLDTSTFSNNLTFAKTTGNSGTTDYLSNNHVQVKGLGFQYSSTQPIIFEDLNLTVASGECLWITGPNGCGKTTLAKIIAGILKPQKGEVIFNGINIVAEPLWKAARYVAYAFQNPDLQIFSTNLWDEVSFGPRMFYSEERCNQLVSHAIHSFGLDGLEKTHPHDLNRSQRKRLGLASTFAMDTSVIILDEPTQFQNSLYKQMIKHAMEEALNKGKGILSITHATDFIDCFIATMCIAHMIPTVYIPDFRK